MYYTAYMMPPTEKACICYNYSGLFKFSRAVKIQSRSARNELYHRDADQTNNRKLVVYYEVSTVSTEHGQKLEKRVQFPGAAGKTCELGE